MQEGERWVCRGWFRDLTVASAVAANHTSQMRLIHAFYEGSQCVRQETIVDLGSTRKSA